VTDCLLWLAEFDSPLDAAWIENETRRFSDSERDRLARIGRTLRREQFVVGHVLLRRLLAAQGAAEAVVEVDFDGRPRLAGATPWRVSLAHCDRTVVALIATAAAGVDIERQRSLRDPAALGAFLGDPHADPASALERWVVAEARIKCGFGAASAWIARRDDVYIAVAGASAAPVLWTHDLINVTYNRVAQKWTAVS
jgi:hypothetical protein